MGTDEGKNMNYHRFLSTIIDAMFDLLQYPQESIAVVISS